MPVQIASNIIPKNGAKWYVVEDIYVKGGLRVVPDAATRDSLYLDSTAKFCLKSGQLLVTADDNKLWQYRGLGVWVPLVIPTAFTFVQATPSGQWDIQHNLNSSAFTYTIFDADGFQVLPDECHIIDVNNLTISFSAAIAGQVTFVFNV